MKKQSVQVKGMVCERCISSVQSALDNLQLNDLQVSLGEITYNSEVVHTAAIDAQLKQLGLAVLKSRNAEIVSTVKNEIATIYKGNSDFPEGFRFTSHITKKLQLPYETISNAFIAEEKQTIEQYMIAYRIDKVKEFLQYTDMRVADIAFNLNYNSVAHLSAQFKQYTGLTLSYFKEKRKKR